jgi:hypothetical protein
MDAIEVRVAGRGTMRGEDAVEDATTRATCSLCGQEAEAVASLMLGDPPDIAPIYACASCLRSRLDALSVGRYRLKKPGAGLPWGKVAG